MELIYQDIPRSYTAIAEWGVCIVYILILKRRHKVFKTAIIAGVFLLLQSVLLILTSTISLYLWFPIMMLAGVGMYLFINACCEGKSMTKVYCTACAFIIGEFAASFEWLLYYYFAYYLGRNTEILKVALLISIYAVIFLLIWKIEKPLLNRSNEFIVYKKELFSVLLLVLVVFMFSNLSFVYPNTPFSSGYFYEVFKLRTLIDFGGMITLFAFQTHKKEMLVAAELNAINAVLRNQYDKYIQYQERIEMVNMKYHDLKHQIMGLRVETDEKKREMWLDSMESEIDTYKNINMTGNKVLDAILDGKLAVAKKHDIEITYVTDGKLLDFMHVTDICTIFGNALDNAIEAEILQPDRSKRLVHMTVSAKRQFILIKVENYCSRNIIIPEGTMKTTKEDAFNHGYGIKSIRYAVEKYNGVMTLGVNNNWFVLNIMIPGEEAGMESHFLPQE